jgi:hypothetical protein
MSEIALFGNPGGSWRDMAQSIAMLSPLVKEVIQ